MRSTRGHGKPIGILRKRLSKRATVTGRRWFEANVRKRERITTVGTF